MRIEDAEAKIASILKSLESENGIVVREVSIDDIDVTTMESDRQVLSRHVRIEFDHVPGTNWAQAPNATS